MRFSSHPTPPTSASLLSSGARDPLASWLLSAAGRAVSFPLRVLLEEVRVVHFPRLVFWVGSYHNLYMLATDKQVKALVNLFYRGTKLAYKKGEFIIRPGERPGGVFFIEKGLVKAYDISKYGEENLLIIRKDHEIFPLIWGVTGQERNIIYQALSECSVWRISREDFVGYVSDPKNPLSPLLDMTMEMYRIHSERIINLEYRSVRERLISFLITMSYRFGEKTNNGVLLNVPLRHQDIASSINATRETTGRELAILERKGLVKNKQLMIVLKDLEALKKFLG